MVVLLVGGGAFLVSSIEGRGGKLGRKGQEEKHGRGEGEGGALGGLS